jgi:hypothetical protein
MNDSAGDGAYSAILKDRLSRFSIKNLNGDGESSVNPKLGTFFNKNDSRIQLSSRILAPSKMYPSVLTRARLFATTVQLTQPTTFCQASQRIAAQFLC